MDTPSGEQWKRLETALLLAFPNEDDLKRLVRFSLSENLDAIAGGDNLTARLHALIAWVVARGKLPALLRAACEERPDNLDLHALAEELGGATHHPQLTEHERRNRTRMLHNVYDYWIKGVLGQSLYCEMLIDLGIAYNPDAVQYPWDMVLHRPDRQDTTLPPHTRMIDVLTEARGELLILGPPGAGKTTMLLDLARMLIERAQQDETLPIPVVFTLSTWAAFVEQHKKQATLADWMVAELHQRYRVQTKTARAWIEHHQILPLLDGLDEVQQQHHASCVEAINTYRTQGGLSFTGLVVCSRLTDYEAIPEKLAVREAVTLQPLTDQQIDTLPITVKQRPTWGPVSHKNWGLGRSPRNVQRL